MSSFYDTVQNILCDSVVWIEIILHITHIKIVCHLIVLLVSIIFHIQ